MVSHLTAPFMQADGYGAISQLHEKLEHYEVAENPMLKSEYAKSIVEIATREHFDRDLKLSADFAAGKLNEEDLGRLHNFLHEIQDAKVNRGMYVIGRPYSGAEADETARLMTVDAIADALFQADLKAGKVREEQRRDLHFESARILETDSSNWESVLTVNKGTAQDVAVGDCVVTEEGFLVGVVTEAGLNWCTIRTILDSDTSIGATVFRSGQNAVAQGDFALMGEGRLRLSYLGANPDVVAGDLVVTSGLGDYFPSQLVIGTVESVSTGDDGLAQNAVIIPSMSLEDLQQVFIVTSFDIVE